MTRHLAYFVHDTGDAAVVRRVRMLHAGGMQVTVIGFHRRGAPAAAIDGAVVFDLGRTGDGRLVQRAWAVLHSLMRIRRVRAAVRDCDVIMARNLEMLVLASRAGEGRRLVYECLDIHRLLLERGIVARLIQTIERRLLQHIDLVITSSRRFIDDYFILRRATTAPLLLVENKVLMLADQPRLAAGPPPRQPWVIGWFGMLRCRRSLHLLLDMVSASNGSIELVLAGIPAVADLGDLAAAARRPGVRYVGRYRPEDLPDLYGSVHFAWAIDYFEEGLNSAWLMPNRLYEALTFGAVPIALAQVETGGWLRQHGVGVVVDSAEALPAILEGLEPTDFASLRAAVAQLPPNDVRMDRAACRALVASIAGDPLPVATV